MIDDHSPEIRTYEDTIMYGDNCLNMEHLSPGIPKVGILIYEIPDDYRLTSIVSQNADTKTYYQTMLN